MKPITVPCVLMRAGTSRGPFFLREWLPADETARDEALIGAIGASDLLQVDGVGGGQPRGLGLVGMRERAALAGGSLDQEFTLAPQASDGGLDWALATPKAKDGPFQHMRVGFRGKDLAAIEIVDSFGQRSVMRFTGFESNPALPASTFQFKPPAGADIVKQ